MPIHVMPKSIDLPLLGSVHVSVVVSFFITVLLCIFCIVVSFLAKHRFKEVPGKFQAMIEAGIGGIRAYSRSQIDMKVGDEMAPHVLAVGMFVFANCFIEFFAIEPPTGDLSLTLTLGLMTLVIINIMGFRHRKLKGRLHHYIEPMAIVAPFKLISELVTPVSLACRLYGNILAGVIVMSLLYAVVPLVIPAALSLYFTLFHALIQSYVFVTLTLSFVKEAVE